MTTSDELCEFAGELLLFLQESANYQTDQELRRTLLAARDMVVGYRKRLRMAQRRFVLAVVGLSNVGKSTLLNALFGIDLASSRNGPCTAVPVEFVGAAQLGLFIDYCEGFRRRTIPCDDHQELCDQLSAVVCDPTGNASRKVRKVTVQLDHPLLAHGLTLADTPGFGAAQIGDADGTHQQALINYLHGDVSQIFWVVLGEQGIGNREQQFYRQLLSDVCDDVIVTGCEDWSERDESRFRRRFLPIFEDRLPNFHFVSGTERTGIEALRERIMMLAHPEGRFQAVADAMRELAFGVSNWVSACEIASRRPLGKLWRPDSWRRLQRTPWATDLRDKIVAIWT